MLIGFPSSNTGEVKLVKVCPHEARLTIDVVLLDGPNV